MHGLVEMKLPPFLACDRPLFMHDFHQLQDGGVAVGGFAAQGRMDVTHRCRAFFPQNLQNFQFLVRWFDVLLHYITNMFVRQTKGNNGTGASVVTKIFVINF